MPRKKDKKKPRDGTAPYHGVLFRWVTGSVRRRSWLWLRRWCRLWPWIWTRARLLSWLRLRLRPWIWCFRVLEHTILLPDKKVLAGECRPGEEKVFAC
jgi:hypothetical protein